MDLPRFFASIRASVFGGRLPQSAVDGCEAILASCRRNGVTDPHHVANILAQVHYETGGYMLPIKETVFASHKDKNPSDATVIGKRGRHAAAASLSDGLNCRGISSSIALLGCAWTISVMTAAR
ncbi:MAG: hypothetical protein V7704_23395 [Aurantimonas endophytica]|uniref:hypothetical protein n=1 Tax=Aurantimonas endophytica TaxID=1522175 RepID=UPI0030024DBF